ncbi:antitoxin MazE family protein [Methylobacterium sp. 10]|uniref:antitoxin MazE family protein n=1 Tax=Methylobacterium sp. 10 TaxID=1101191 RepID=UPI000485CEBE|nr:antitoxin MazE family protein [Methylobacterium sp. 10]
MSAPPKSEPIIETIRQRHARLRRQGLRPVKIWIPDPSSASFAEEAHRQSAAVATSHHAKDDQSFIDAASNWDDA